MSATDNEHYIGEHGWRVYERDGTLERISRELGHPGPQVDHQSVRIRAGWRRELAHVVVNSDSRGNPYISITKEEKYKTKDMYRTVRGGVDIHNTEDYRRFMQVMREAGERAGWVE